MDFKILKKRLYKLDTACICDANKNLRVMDPGIKPINQGLKMTGIAHTVHSKGDFLAVIKGLYDAGEDEVLVIDAEGKKIAIAGELFSMEASRKKLGGIIIDGGCRDVKQVQRIRFPVYARYITPLAGTASNIFKTQTKITCGGVDVSSGDIIFGDDDGVVVMSEEELIGILDLAENIQKKEEKVLSQIEDGKSLIDMLNFFDHYEKISEQQESILIFTV
ncbi:MAG: RraA family protein [Candidatus Aminicenantaceae bacterium]